ncbi:lipopolysaccharide biosynthesis protein [Ottowia beijingensis]|uniref:lipopolysaccharide biosynthesis protein n=1 Tax=Ottowia beijingensis TaxID=1207057 RepID=UPI00362D48CC
MTHRMGAEALRQFLRRALDGPQLFVVASQLMRVGLLTLYLFAGTRLLGPGGYGALATAVALAAIGATLVGLGSGIGLVRLASRDAAVFPQAWGACLARHVASGLLILCAYALFAGQWLSGPLFADALVPIGIAELLLVPLISAVGYAFIAHARYRMGALIQSLPAVARFLVAAVLLWRGAAPDVGAFALWVLLAMAAACVLAILLACAWLPWPACPRLRAVLTPDYSVAYAGSNLVNSLAGEADKLAVYRLTSADQTGIYSATTRIMAAFAIPFGALIQSRSHHLFALGTAIGPGHMQFLRRYAMAFAGYGVICVLVSLLAAPYLVRWLGPGFEAGGALVAILAFWVPLNGFRQLVGSLLTTSDRAWRRSFSDILTTGVFVVAALVLVPANGVTGAAEAKLAAEFIGLMATFLIFMHARKTSR